jgi:hypothetical protein
LRNLYFRNNGEVTTQFNEDEGCLMGATDNLEYREDDDITKEEIQEGYAAFDQKTISFTKQLTDEQLDKIKDAHEGAGDNYDTYNYGYISCNDFNGNKVAGWLLECQYNIYSKLARFKLLKRHIAGVASTGIAWDCLPTSGVFTIRNVSNNYFQVAQWISLPIGELRKIYIEKTDAGAEYVYIYICAVRWNGYPNTGTKIYNELHLLSEGDNEIDINLDVTTADCYTIGIRYANEPDLRTVGQIGFTDLPCVSDYIMPSQTNTTAATGNWAAPTTTEALRHKLEVLPTSINLKTLMICSNSIGIAHIIDSLSEVAAQQIEFKSNVTLHNVSFYVFEGGAPTKTLLCGVYKYDATKDGNLGDHIATSYEATPAADWEVAFSFANTYSLDAGKYVFTLFPYILSAGTLDGLNYYLPAYALHEDAYMPGLPRQFKDGSWTEYSSHRQIMKVRYELN